MIEKVMLNVTLKSGKDVWQEGTILEAPLPPDILQEIKDNTGTVNILKGGPEASTKMVFVAERVKEKATSMTTVAPKPPPIKQNKPKPKLRRIK
jgi:hypothetical protein